MSPCERVLLHDVKPEVRDAGCLDDPRPLQFDRPVAQAVEEPDALPEQDRHQVYANLVDQAGRDALLRHIGPVHTDVYSVSPAKYQSKSGPTSPLGLAMKLSSDVENPCLPSPPSFPLSRSVLGNLIGQLLQGPAVPVGIAEGGVEYPAEVPYLAHFHPSF
jgi:hypothetical protein